MQTIYKLLKHIGNIWANIRNSFLLTIVQHLLLSNDASIKIELLLSGCAFMKALEIFYLTFNWQIVQTNIVRDLSAHGYDKRIKYLSMHFYPFAFQVSLFLSVMPNNRTIYVDEFFIKYITDILTYFHILISIKRFFLIINLLFLIISNYSF